VSRAILDAAFASKKHHLSPFLVLGDPTPEVSFELAKKAVELGATMLEVGIAYGDPSADGPAIQKANLRAMAAKANTEAALGVMRRIHEAFPSLPMNLLVYGNLVHARGFAAFARDAVAAGASSLLVPDVLFEEGDELRAACKEAGLGHAELVGPLTDPRRVKRLAETVDAYLYLVAFQGVTGARAGGAGAIGDLVQRTASLVSSPVCVGFGLSSGDHVASVFDAGARVAVVGSHLANAIEAGVEAGPLGAGEHVIASFAKAFAPLAETARRYG
jgi:tryptophan synthase alpha chain